MEGKDKSNNNNSGGPPGPRGPRRFGGHKPFRLAPVGVGQEYDVTIESTSRRGDSGVAKIQGLVVFIAGAKVGESMRVRVTKVGSGFATAEKVTADENSIESLSPDAETSGDNDE